MIYCPDCRKEIPAEDFNVSTDIAFCRRCGKNHRYSALADFEVRADFCPDEPPRGVRIAVDERFEEVLLLRYYRASSWVLLLVTLCWWGFLWLFFPGFQALFSSDRFPVAIPAYMAGGVLLIACVILSMFGRDEFRIEGSRLEVLSGVGAVSIRRYFHLNDIRRISIEEEAVSEHGNERLYRLAVLLRKNGKRRVVARSSDRRVLEFVAGYVHWKMSRSFRKEGNNA